MNTDRVAFEVYQGGEGSPLVLLHGLGGSWHIWKPVLPLLERRHRVIAPTLPGHPGGARLPANVEPSVRLLVDTLLGQLKGMGIEQAHVAGNSLGGWLCLEMARRNFALSVTAFSPAGAWRSAADFRSLRRGLLIPFFLMPLIYGLSYLLMGIGAVRRGLSARTMQRGDRLGIADFRSMLLRFMATRFMPRLFANVARTGPIEPLPAGRAPVRVFWSQHDKVIPFEAYGAPMLERLPGAQFLSLRGVGHVPMHDDPEAVAAAILGTTSHELPGAD